MRRVPKHQIYKIVPKNLGTIFSLKDSDYYYVDTVSDEIASQLIRTRKLSKSNYNCYQNNDMLVVASGNSNLVVSTKPTIVNEDTRLQIISKSKSSSNLNRYNRRLPIKNYDTTFKVFDVREFRKTGSLVVDVMIGDYSCIIQVNNFLKRLKKLDSVTHKSIRLELAKALDSEDILIDCSCPDFRYRYSYIATVGGYKYGKKETRVAKKTNPNNEGSMCKHLSYILSNKSWVSKYASSINSFLKSNPEILGGY